jgi:arginyl-tRNA synthetase
VIFRPDEARRLIRDSLVAAASEMAGRPVQVSLAEPRHEGFGDLGTQVAMELAPGLGRPPRQIADALVSLLHLPDGLVSCVSVDGPGFINLTFSRSYYDAFLRVLGTEGLRPLVDRPGEGRKALVEFVSSNPTGPLNVGHCRQAVLGEAVSGLLEVTGWTVEREYYFNDSGLQTLLLGESLASRYLEGSPGEIPIPENGYHGDYIEGWARDLASSRGRGLSWPGDSQVFVDHARTRAMDLIHSDLEMLGIEFDRYFSESSLIPEAVEEAIARLSDVFRDGSSLIFEEPAGSGKKWLRLTALGRPEDRVLVRDNGMYTYRAPDIAYHLDKFRRGYDLLVDIFGSDHLDTSQDVTAALSALLGEERVRSTLRVILHQFVTLVREGRKVKMSTRAANFVTLRELIEEVGSADVTRYLFLTRKAEAHMDFDLDLARRQSDENPVYYVQYAYARIAGIIRTAEAQGASPSTAPGALEGELEEPAERRLVKMLESVPGRTAACAEALEPHRLTEILAEIATAFHSFYQKHRVVDPDAPRRTSARLLLCAACRNTIRDLLGTLGVEAPERM